MSELIISDLIANNARLTASNEKLTNSVAELTKTQAWMTADKENMERRMGHQISRLKRKSNEMDDGDSSQVEHLRQKLADTQQELADERHERHEAAVVLKMECRHEIMKKDDELKKMKSDADKHIEANARLWKEKNDLLKTGNRELLAKYEKLKKDNYELAKRYDKLKTQYEKKHNELNTIKRTMGPSSSAFVLKSPESSTRVNVKQEYVGKEEVDENTNELEIAE